MNSIDAFAEQLANIGNLHNAENLYRHDDPMSAIRLHNLKLYLRFMYELRPTRILVGEAPGYKGCKLTGIPFTSEKILLNDINNVPIFGKDKGYKKIDELSAASEQSATIIWSHLSTYDTVPLLWNAFPFHPFKTGNSLSNRKPTPSELKLGGEILRELIALFNVQEVIAVGNSAHETLQAIGIPSKKVRHPANGGKTQFVAETAILMQE